MSVWHASVVRFLRESGLFADVQLIGGKVRALLSAARFLDVHFDPTTTSSFALIDLTLPYTGDKRLFGWADFPHLDYDALTLLKSYPHHFQDRLPDGTWQFFESTFRGDVENEIREVIETVRQRTSGKE